MTTQRTLADLYVRGQDVTLDDGAGPVTVWVQKLNPVEHSLAVRKGDAARARQLAIKFDKECDEYLALLNDALNADRDVLIELLTVVEEARILPIHEAKLGDDEEWKKENYLQGLRDAWRDEMADRFENDPDDVEAKRVRDELERFIIAMRIEVDSELDSFRHTLSTVSDRDLIDMSMEHRIRAAGDVAWVNAYYRAEIGLGVRDSADRQKKAFAKPEDVDILQAEAYGQLAAAFQNLTVEPVEGKDLAGLPPSSDSSEASDKEGTEVSSGPTASAA